MTTMNAWVVRAGRLRFEDVPVPVPNADELLLRVEAVSLNRGEIRTVSRAADGTIPGWDVAGTVVAPAASGKGPAEGARVAAILNGGGWAQLARVPADHAAVIPDDVTLEQAATLPIAGLTVMRALDVAGSMLGRSLLVTGASGGVGQLAIQLGASAGAVVTAVSSRGREHEHLRSLGAREIVPAIDAATGTYDLVLESVGGASLGAAINLVARGGLIVTIGNSSEQDTTFNARSLYGKGGARIYGLLVFEELERRTVGGRDLARLLTFVRQGSLDPPIGMRGSWTDLATVLEQLQRRDFPGKAVLTA